MELKMSLKGRSEVGDIQVWIFVTEKEVPIVGQCVNSEECNGNGPFSRISQ